MDSQHHPLISNEPIQRRSMNTKQQESKHQTYRMNTETEFSEKKISFYKTPVNPCLWDSESVLARVAPISGSQQ